MYWESQNATQSSNLRHLPPSIGYILGYVPIDLVINPTYFHSLVFAIFFGALSGHIFGSLIEEGYKKHVDYANRRKCTFESNCKDKEYNHHEASTATMKEVPTKRIMQGEISSEKSTALMNSCIMKENESCLEIKQEEQIDIPNQPVERIQHCKTRRELKENLLRAGGKLVVIYFYATRSGTCKRIAPKIVEIATEFQDVLFLKVDVDQNADATKEYDITSMPTFLLIKDEKKVSDLTGADADKLRELVKQLK